MWYFVHCKKKQILSYSLNYLVISCFLFTYVRVIITMYLSMLEKKKKKSCLKYLSLIQYIRMRWAGTGGKIVSPWRC